MQYRMYEKLTLKESCTVATMARNKSPCRYTSKVTLESQRRTHMMCVVCKSKTVFKCIGCKKAFYCGKEHQRMHWSEHKYECKLVFRKKGPGVIRHTQHDEEKELGPGDCFINATKLRCYNELISYVLLALRKVGLCIIDEYIYNEIAERISIEVGALYFTPGVFREAEKTVPDQGLQSIYRSDLTAWVTGHEKICPNIRSLAESFDNLVTSLKLDDTLEDKIKERSKVQVSCFPPNSFGYKRHVDNPNNNGRLITTVYYCNKNYSREKDGGVTRFYIKNSTKYVDVEPNFNRAVIYWSDTRIISETVPCNRKMFSLTTWFINSEKEKHELWRTSNEGYTNKVNSELTARKRTCVDSVVRSPYASRNGSYSRLIANPEKEILRTILHDRSHGKDIHEHNAMPQSSYYDNLTVSGTRLIQPRILTPV